MRKLNPPILFTFVTGLCFDTISARAENPRMITPQNTYDVSPKILTEKLRPFFRKMKLYAGPEGSYFLQVPSKIISPLYRLSNKNGDPLFHRNLGEIFYSRSGKEYFELDDKGHDYLSERREERFTFDDPELEQKEIQHGNKDFFGERGQLHLNPVGSKLICGTKITPFTSVNPSQAQRVLRKSRFYPLPDIRYNPLLLKFAGIEKYFFWEGGGSQTAFLGPAGKMLSLGLGHVKGWPCATMDLNLYLDNGDMVKFIPRLRSCRASEGPSHYAFSNGENFVLEEVDINEFDLTRLRIDGVPQKTQYQMSPCLPELFFPILKPDRIYHGQY